MDKINNQWDRLDLNVKVVPSVLLLTLQWPLRKPVLLAFPLLCSKLEMASAHARDLSAKINE